MTSSQVRKDYANDWAKAKSREAVKSVIERNLLRFRRPKDMTVLCFPGVDAAEVIQVYDTLGIPRENVVGIEQDPRVYDQLRKRQLGINLGDAPRTVEDYVTCNPSMDFDVVSLDYTGPLSGSQINVLMNLVDQQRKDHFVLHHANLAKRDESSYGLYLIGNSFMDLSKPHKIEVEDFNEVNRRISKGLSSMKSEESVERQIFRATGYSLMLTAAIAGSRSKDIDELLRFSQGRDYRSTLATIQKTLREYTGNEDLELDAQAPFTKFTERYGVRADIGRILESTIEVGLQRVLWDSGVKDVAVEEAARVVHAALSDTNKKRKIFRILDAEAYKYISESGAPMIGDIYFLSHPREAVKAAERVSRMLGYPGEIRICEEPLIYQASREFTKKTKRFLPKEQQDEVRRKLNDRSFLGSSAKPVLTKKDAIREFREGASIDDLREKYRGVDTKPVAAWKAHVTMGTYDKGKKTERIEPKTGLEEKVNCDEKPKLSKADVLDLLSSGFTPDDIIESYPDSFTIGQLRAYKAHLTMKTYEGATGK